MERKRRIVTLIAMIAVIAGAALFAYSKAVDSTGRHEKAAIKDAVISSAVQCCSIEGNYPQDLEYLKVNYGLQIDGDKYIVVYEAVGSNVMPQVTVLEKGK